MEFQFGIVSMSLLDECGPGGRYFVRESQLGLRVGDTMKQ